MSCNITLVGTCTNSIYLGAHLYTATGAEGSTFAVTHGLNLAAPYLVMMCPQGAHDAPTFDPAPVGGAQTSTSCDVATDGPLTAGDRFLLTFYTVPA